MTMVKGETKLASPAEERAEGRGGGSGGGGGGGGGKRGMGRTDPGGVVAAAAEKEGGVVGGCAGGSQKGAKSDVRGGFATRAREPRVVHPRVKVTHLLAGLSPSRGPTMCHLPTGPLPPPPPPSNRPPPYVTSLPLLRSVVAAATTIDSNSFLLLGTFAGPLPDATLVNPRRELEGARLLRAGIEFPSSAESAPSGEGEEVASIRVRD
jgi:hypothetical protein